MLRAGCRLTAFYAAEDELAAELRPGLSACHAGRRRARDPGRPRHPARGRRRHPRRARADGAARHARRQGRHARQARLHLAAQLAELRAGSGRHRPHLLDLLLRALPAARDRRGLPAGRRRRDRSGVPHHRPRPPPARPSQHGPTGSGTPPAMARSCRHRLASVRAVPLLHRLHPAAHPAVGRSQFRQSRPAPDGGLRPRHRRLRPATGFVRVDWFTPDGSPVWGDGRLFLWAPKALSSFASTWTSRAAPAATTCS